MLQTQPKVTSLVTLRSRAVMTCIALRMIWPLRLVFKKEYRDFPGGEVVKNPPANSGDMGSSPGLGRSHMLRGN